MFLFLECPLSGSLLSLTIFPLPSPLSPIFPHPSPIFPLPSPLSPIFPLPSPLSPAFPLLSPLLPPSPSPHPSLPPSPSPSISATTLDASCPLWRSHSSALCHFTPCQQPVKPVTQVSPVSPVHQNCYYRRIFNFAGDPPTPYRVT